MSARIVSVADVASEQAVPLLRQLCRAFGHHCESRFDDATGYVEFGFGRCELRASRRRLTVTASAWERADCDRVRRLVTRQLERAGRREALQVHWH